MAPLYSPHFPLHSPLSAYFRKPYTPMKFSTIKLARGLCIAALAALSLSATAERRWLITHHSQLSTNKPISSEDKIDIYHELPNGEKRYYHVNRIGLTDGDPVKDDALTKEEREMGGTEGQRWESWDDPNASERNFLQVELKKPLNELISPEETLVVYTKRHARSGHGHPTGFEIRASETGNDWDNAPVIAYAYLIYRGNNRKNDGDGATVDNNSTKEYSARLEIPEDEKKKPYKYLRFYVTANNTKNRVTDTDGNLTDRRTMKLLSFNVMSLGPDDNYSDILVDRFHLLTDYSYKYYNYDFVNTLGIFEPRNRKSKVYYGGDKLLDYDITGYTKWPGESGSPWTDAGDSIYWNKDVEFLKNINVKMPVYKKTTHKDDIRISENSTVPETQSPNWRQPVHEVEHVLYAIPGDPIALYPFYEFGDPHPSTGTPNTRYHNTFIHWYNYRTGGNVKEENGTRLLDFLVDPSIVCKSANYGFYTGLNISGYTKFDSTDQKEPPTESNIISISSVDELIAFQQKLNSGEYSNIQKGLQVTLDPTQVYDFTGKDFEPIGTTEHPFIGTFNGQGATISNLVINRPEDSHIGLFGHLKSDYKNNVGINSVILNINLDNSCRLIGKQYIGLVAKASIGWNLNVTIENVVTQATLESQMTGTNQWGNKPYIAGLIATAEGQGTIIKDCVVAGKIIAENNINIIGNLNNGNISNCISTATIEAKSDTPLILFAYPNEDWAKDIFSNCFSTYANPNDKTKRGLNELRNDENGYYFENPDSKVKTYVNSQDFAQLLGSEWIFSDGMEFPMPFANARPSLPDPDVPNVNLDDVPGLKAIEQKIYGQKPSYGMQEKLYAGNVATFFYPRPTNPEGKGIMTELPTAPNGTFGNTDYLIAADIATVFADGSEGSEYNVDDSQRKIYEPTILWRHIFRIKDGKAFAEEFSGSVEKNREYVRNNRRIISTPLSQVSQENPFQIRLDCPIPVEETGQYPSPSKYYYKISDTDYRRVRSSEIYVFKWNEATGDFDKTPTEEVTFKSDYAFKGMGSRTFENTIYNICGAGGNYNRYLVCQSAKEGRYLVRLIGKDINGDKIEIYKAKDPNNKHLILQEFDITFLPNEQGHMDAFADGEAKDKQMNENFGLPNAKIDYDEYDQLLIKKTQGKLGVEDPDDYFLSMSEGKQLYKWPYVWDHSSYGFGYSMNKQSDQQAYNYNIYKIANNSDVCPWSNTATDVKDVKYKKSPEDNKQAGFFYYMNSSSDPGVAARLELEDLCPGSKIYISAYLNEFSGGGEKGNMVFNFTAVGKNKERVVIQSLVSGYIPNTGEWNHVYFEFMPDLDKKKYAEGVLGGVDHYEIELDNNCKSSEQADYAVDDIKIYVVQPQVFAKQMQPLCEAMVQTPVKIQLPFEPLLASLGYNEVTETSAHRMKAMSSPYYMKETRANNEQNDNLRVYYCFVDKAKFDKLYSKVGYEQAFNEARLKYQYDLTNESHEQTFGVIKFSNLFSGNTPYPGNPADVAAALKMKGTVYAETQDGVRYLTLITVPEKGDKDLFIPGEQYYIALYINDIEGISPGAHEFDILNRCSHTSEFTVESANTIIITNDNGNVTLPNDTYCLGSSPTVEIILSNIKKPLDGGGYEHLENGKLDWYAGTLNQFNEEKSSNGEYLQEALMKLREINDEPLTVEGLNDIATDENFTKSMKEMIKKLMQTTYKDGRKKLELGKPSHTFPELQASATDSLNYAVAIPVIPLEYQNQEGQDVQYCGSPMEIRLKASANAPGMFHGLQIDYPEEMVDVPVRIGLNQIRAAQTEDNTLRIPLVEVSSPTTHATGIKLREGTANEKLTGKEVLLIQTDDSRYSDLALTGVPETDHDAAATTTKANDAFEYHGIFPIVGKIVRIDARKATKDEYVPSNAFYVQFDSRFEFREGYTYILKFDIEEDGPDGFQTMACPGQHVFTIKVVPEYLVWNGDTDNRNWNNDDNWSRVAPEDIYPDMHSDELALSGTSIAEDERRNFTTGETTDVNEPTQNTNRHAFAPMEFTKVIIDSKGREATVDGQTKKAYSYPSLYEIKTETVNGMPTITSEPHFPEKMQWANLSADGYTTPTGLGDPTDYIHYDMAATTQNLTDFGYADKEGVKVAVAIKPWYANTAEQVHFRTDSRIDKQQWLRYDKAWVEMEMAPERWYLAASPLKQTVAGDMYLPTSGARQVTRLFTEINFDHKADNTGLNNRFAPAVYQRGWDKGTATVYELKSNSSAETRNVAVALDWSHVYNEVKEPYEAGMGYSIKTDITEAKDFDMNKGKVLFRFPKADNAYEYWDITGTDHDNNVEGGNLGDRTDRHRLQDAAIEAKLENGGGSKYFLAGNPYMANLDITKFFETNSGKIQPKLWLIDADKQIAVTVNEDGTVTSNENESIDALAPMQGFFVEAAQGTRAASNLTLSFKADMTSVKTTATDNPKTRSASADGNLRITPMADGREGTSAVVRLDATADKGYNPDEDMVLLDDPKCETPRAFTISGNKAALINATDNADGMEIGVIAPKGTATKLVIDNTADFSHLLLLDTATGETTPLHDGMTLQATGSVAGRFFLVGSTSTSKAELLGLRLTIKGNDVTVIAPNAETGLEVAAFTPDGMKTAAVECDGEVTLTLEKGVYIITARASDGYTLRKKIII